MKALLQEILHPVAIRRLTAAITIGVSPTTRNEAS